MSLQTINVGAAPGDGNGDSGRVGGQKINANFAELYGLLGNGTDLTPLPSFPSGAILGATDNQTITGKTISGANNTISGLTIGDQVSATFQQSLVPNGDGTLNIGAADARIDTLFVQNIDISGGIDGSAASNVTPATGDRFMVIDESTGEFAFVLFQNLPGASGGLTAIVQDTAPQLGGNLDLNGHQIGGVTAAQLGHLSGVTSGIQAQIDSKEPSNANIIKTDQAATLTVGYSQTPVDKGVVSSGTMTAVIAEGAMQTYTNGGAHSLGVPADSGSVMIEVTNDASAGAIDTTAFAKITGDPLTTTDGDKFHCVINKVTTSTLHIQALQ